MRNLPPAGFCVSPRLRTAAQFWQERAGTFPDMTALLQSRSSSVAFAMRFLAFVALLLALTLGSARAVDVQPAAGAPKVEVDHNSPTAAAAGEAHEEHHALPPAAPVLREGGFVNSSMIVTWIVAAALIIFAQMATRRIRSASATLP